MKFPFLPFVLVAVGCTALTPRWERADEGTPPSVEALKKQPVAVSLFFPNEELALLKHREFTYPVEVARELGNLRQRGPERWKTHWQNYCPDCTFRRFSTEVAGLNPTAFLEGMRQEDAVAHLKHWIGAFVRDPLLVGIVLTDRDYRREVQPSGVHARVESRLKLVTYWIPRQGESWKRTLTGTLSSVRTYERRPEGLEWLAGSVKDLASVPGTSEDPWDRVYPYPHAPEVERWLDASLRKVTQSLL